jgi:hypothetical protein
VFTVDYFHHRIHLWVYGSNKYFYYLFKHLFNKIITIKMFLLKKQKGYPQAFGSAKKKYTYPILCFKLLQRGHYRCGKWEIGAGRQSG